MSRPVSKSHELSIFSELILESDPATATLLDELVPALNEDSTLNHDRANDGLFRQFFERLPHDLKWSGANEITRSKIAFALIDVIGFSEKAAGYILKEAPHTVANTSRLWKGAVKRASEPGVLIIEDEGIIALDLANIVRGTGLRVHGTAESYDQAAHLTDEPSRHYFGRHQSQHIGVWN